MTFREITHDEIEKLREILARLPAGSITDIFKGRNKSEAEVATLDGALHRIRKVLEADYDANTIESANAAWTFEYQVTVGETNPGEMAVLTRLFHPERTGSISYGRYVRRRDDDYYVLWIED